MTEFEFRQLLGAYYDGDVQTGALEEHLLSLCPSEETDLSRDLVGLLAEASHAHWAEGELREELLNAIRPFVQRFAENHYGDSSWFSTPESYSDSATNCASAR
jgi:hypothetical protein